MIKVHNINRVLRILHKGLQSSVPLTITEILTRGKQLCIKAPTILTYCWWPFLYTPPTVVRSWNIGKINKNLRDTPFNCIWLKRTTILVLEGRRYHFFTYFHTIFHRQITEILMGKKCTIWITWPCRVRKTDITRVYLNYVLEIYFHHLIKIIEDALNTSFLKLNYTYFCAWSQIVKFSLAFRQDYCYLVEMKTNLVNLYKA